MGFVRRGGHGAAVMSTLEENFHNVSRFHCFSRSRPICSVMNILSLIQPNNNQQISVDRYRVIIHSLSPWCVQRIKITLNDREHQ